MGPRLNRNKNLLRIIANAAPKEQKRLLCGADCDFINACRDCCKNILEGRISIPSKVRQKIFRHKEAVRKLGRPTKLSLKTSRKILQTGGFFASLIPILGSLIGPVLSGIFGQK